MPKLHTAKLLVSSYLVLSVATVGAVAVLSGVAPHLVNAEAWVRGVIVAGTSFLTFRFATQAERGRPRALLRLRIVVMVLLVAFGGVLFFLQLPLWMRVEQGVCLLILLATAVLAFQAVDERSPAAVGS